MKMFFKSFLTLALLVAGTAIMNGQTAAKVGCSPVAAKSANCDPANCTPAMCDAMVAAGLCTKEQAAACKAKMGTKVASAKLERTETNVITVSSTIEKTAKTSSCAKTCAKAKAKTAKKTTP